MPPPPLAAPQPLPRGRHRLATPVVERVQRERILQATAKVVTDNGYADVTVADIVACAGISREVFYANFHDKRDAFVATYRHGFEQTLVTAAEAFFTSSGEWPERVWDSGLAFTKLFASVPSLAYLGFVESYSLGPEEALRTDDTMLAFTVFLEDGYRYRPQASHLPRLLSQAIAGAVLETAVTYVRRDRVAELPGLLPIITYMILAPFTGTDAARKFVDRKVRELEARRT
jgi:AcrR family transcriptional regulator